MGARTGSSGRNIAVIGSGIAGNGAAWALAAASDHAVTVYEAETRAGGHAATVDIDYDGVPIAVDTGFIVYNEPNYPNLTRLFAHLGVATQPSDMSFSVSRWDDERGVELAWTSRAADLLGGRLPIAANVPSPVHLRVLRDIVRFNRRGAADLEAGRLGGLTLGEYLARERYSQRFREDYVVAMGSAIWSMPPGDILAFPAATFLAFFANHRLLRLDRPTWRTVTGGSRAYVRALTAPFAERLRLGTPVTRIAREDEGVRVVTADGASTLYDEVVLACHCDQAAALLADATPAERAMLGAIRYRDNAVWLHRDESLMPRARSAWAAWNVVKRPGDEVCVTYWMNALQGLDPARPLFVSLNPPRPPREGTVFARTDYAHPQFDQSAVAAQAALAGLQGKDRVWFCGAWTKYGFHEDGLHSGLAVAEALGAVAPWRVAPRDFGTAAA
ncbi:NAD/FAD-binding protein [Salinarimonas ramus]|uniref:NAD/FAD-binding protein n=1 Tax=Salinarimonas ramus TaxID=690164 RepID=A0A917Q433_9HYPH|nr:NAD/FAD-binding protein [Salinarimonas ramus]